MPLSLDPRCEAGLGFLQGCPCREVPKVVENILQSVFFLFASGTQIVVAFDDPSPETGLIRSETRP